MRAKRIVLTIIFIFIFIILIIPEKHKSKETDTVEYRAILYTFTKIREETMTYGYRTGTRLEILGLLIYEDIDDQSEYGFN